MHASRRALLRAAPFAAAAVLTGCSVPSEDPEPAGPEPAAPAAPDGTGTLTTILTTTLTSGLQAPWAITFHGDTALLSERDSARIIELAPDGTAREVGVIDGVTHGGEGGLLGLAVLDGRQFSYATSGSGNRIEHRELRGESGALTLGPAGLLLDAIPSAANHNGGRLKIGPDGMLYATTGDAGDRASAQDLGSLAGKILRLAPDGAVPADNPFPGSPVYSYGHRNPQGIAWTEDGQLVASEFGQSTWDELNLIAPGGSFGWPDVEGMGDREGHLDPLLQWSPEQASPSGIAILGGVAYIACLRGQRLRVVPLAEPESQTALLEGQAGRLRDAVVAPDGSLWVLTNTTDGRGEPAPDGDRVLRLTVG